LTFPPGTACISKLVIIQINGDVSGEIDE
jgi:hypothetical protein